MDESTKLKLIELSESLKKLTEQANETATECYKALDKLGKIKKTLCKKRTEINKMLVLKNKE